MENLYCVISMNIAWVVSIGCLFPLFARLKIVIWTRPRRGGVIRLTQIGKVKVGSWVSRQ